MDEHTFDDYILVDVRQPEEFEAGHLAGATAMPLGELPTRLEQISADKPALVYCRSGGRAANGVALLNQQGFHRAVNIGGIMQWEGLVATGAPEAGMAWFDEARSAEEYVAVAWGLEEGTRQLYLHLAHRFPGLASIFEPMADGEEQHKATLARLHRKLGGVGPEPSPPEQLAGVVEGGMRNEDVLRWIGQKEAEDVLELAVVMEANAHDRYIRVGRGLTGDARDVFVQLARAEKVHLDRLQKAFIKRIHG